MWRTAERAARARLSDEQYVQCLKRADELFIEWPRSPARTSSAMMCHEKYQMDEYSAKDGMKKSGYLAIEWGNLGENDDVPAGLERGVRRGGRGGRTRSAKALDAAAAAGDAETSAEASAEAPATRSAAARGHGSTRPTRAMMRRRRYRS